MFFDDLDTILCDPTTRLKPHVPYKAWADNFYNLQHSSISKASIDWHVSRLRGISKNTAALFPTERVPEWFIGSSEGWIDSSRTVGPTRKPLTSNGLGIKGITGKTALPDIGVLKVHYNIDRSQIVKAALAVTTTLRTNQPYALFGQTFAGRAWPFMLDWQSDSMPSAMDVNGPTIGITLSKSEVKKTEKVIDMLSRFQKEQSLLSRHSCAPMNHIINTLNGYEPQKEDPHIDGKIKGLAWIKEGGEGDFVVDAWKRQYFNWLPVLQFDYKRLQNVQIESRGDCGIVWNCLMLDHTTVSIHSTWDDAQLRLKEVEDMLAEILRLSSLFAMSENWNRRVEEFL